MLRDEYGSLSYYVEELREIIFKAALHDRLTGLQRDELLAVLEEIDEERKALVGGA